MEIDSDGPNEQQVLAKINAIAAAILEDCLTVGGQYDICYEEVKHQAVQSHLDDYWRSRMFVMILRTEMESLTNMNSMQITELAEETVTHVFPSEEAQAVFRQAASAPPANPGPA